MNQPFRYGSEVSEHLAEVIALTLGIPRDQIDQYVASRREGAQRRLARHRARWAAAIDSMTDVQAVLVSKAEQEGYSLGKFLIDHHSSHVAALMVKNKVWDDRKGRMGRKLLVIYPDGLRSTTMERTISIKKAF